MVFMTFLIHFKLLAKKIIFQIHILYAFGMKKLNFEIETATGVHSGSYQTLLLR